MENTTKIVYAMHIVNENEGVKFPEVFIDLSEPIGFSNMSVEDLWRSINNRYIDNSHFIDQFEKKKYYDKITIEFWIAERIEGHGVDCLRRDCKLLHKIVSLNVDMCEIYSPSPFVFLMKTMFNQYPETKADVLPTKFDIVI